MQVASLSSLRLLCNNQGLLTLWLFICQLITLHDWFLGIFSSLLLIQWLLLLLCFDPSHELISIASRRPLLFHGPGQRGLFKDGLVDRHLVDSVIENAKLDAYIGESEGQKAGRARRLYPLVTLNQHVIIAFCRDDSPWVRLLMHVIILCDEYLSHLWSGICHWKRLTVIDKKILSYLFLCRFSPECIHLILWTFRRLTSIIIIIIVVDYYHLCLGIHLAPRWCLFVKMICFRCGGEALSLR